MLPWGKLRHAASLLLLGLTMGKSLGSLTKHCAPASKKYGLIERIVIWVFFLQCLCKSNVDMLSISFGCVAAPSTSTGISNQ